ncbi:serine/threonine-protein kinase [Herbidospora mongoliensis]|uniref:serine/threonine-protein kinase n=1 Tax=Herbidospora mongoliensis TaxID=688067 RepID=UPI0008346B9B|nr:serine/threonine-protein kinase [Herbidospora mongoliensis]
MAESIGERLASRYLLLRPLGAGGMGTVWLARDEMLDREVAVKELRVPEGMGGRERAELVTRVMREAEVTARLRHPAVVAVHDVLVEDGRPWIVMERLNGRSLSAEIAAHGGLQPGAVAEIGARMVDALSAAHAHGVQHRDVKPGNVFLTSDGRVVLTDFGIARQADTTNLTGDGMLIGSPGFIAPERLEGHPGGPAADLWSLGATLYTALEGEAPYRGNHIQVIQDTLTAPVPVPRTAGPLGTLVAWLMARDPADRPDAATAVRLFEEIVRGGNPQIAPPRKPRRIPWVAVAAGLAAVVVAAVVVVAPWEPAEETPVAGRRPPAPVFAAAVDLCRVVPAEQVKALLGQPARPTEIKGGCQWTTKGTGLRLEPATDSDTADWWDLSPEAARALYGGLERHVANKPRDSSLIWYEIGANRRLPTVISVVRPLTGVGEEAFSWDITSAEGRLVGVDVYFRVGDFVGWLEYADLGDRTADQIRAGAESASRAAADALWGHA